MIFLTVARALNIKSQSRIPRYLRKSYKMEAIFTMSKNPTFQQEVGGNKTTWGRRQQLKYKSIFSEILKIQYPLNKSQII